MKRIDIDTNLEPVEIADENGNLLGTIRLNLGDAGMISRAQKVSAHLAAVGRSFSAGKAPDESLFLQAEQEIKDAFNELFGCDFSDIWRHLSPIAIMNDGTFFWERLFHSLMPLIEEAVKANTASSAARMGKHISGYTAGKE